MNANTKVEAARPTDPEAVKKLQKNGHGQRRLWFDPLTVYPNITAPWRWWIDQGALFWSLDGFRSISEDKSSQRPQTNSEQQPAKVEPPRRPETEIGKAWQFAWRTCIQWWRQSGKLPISLMESGQEMTQIWQEYMEQWQAFNQPWQQAWALTPWYFGQGLLGDETELMELNQMYQAAYEQTFGQMLENPQVGQMRELNLKMLQGFDAWIELQFAAGNYYALLSAIPAEATKQFWQELFKLGRQGEPLESVQGLMNLWFDAIDDVMVGLYDSDEYLQTQAELVKAETIYQTHQQALLEEFLKSAQMPVPTLRDFDEVARSQYQMGRRVKKLERRVQRLEQAKQN